MFVNSFSTHTVYIMVKTKHPDLLIILIWATLNIIFALNPVFNVNFFRKILELPMILFVPGYALTAAIFPGKSQSGPVERIALSFGLSTVITPLVFFSGNYIPELRLFPIFLVISIFTIIFVIIAAYRLGNLNDDEKFAISFKKNLNASFQDSDVPKGRSDKFLTYLLIFLLVIGIGMVVFVVITPKMGEKFTEFYILGPSGKAGDYPSNLIYGSPVSIRTGVVNHEYTSVNYTIKAALNASVLTETQFNLDNNGIWEDNLTIVPDKEGRNMKLEFLLFKDNNFTAPYRELHLWVSVSR